MTLCHVKIHSTVSIPAMLRYGSCSGACQFFSVCHGLMYFLNASQNDRRHMRHFEMETKTRERYMRHEAHEALVATQFFLVAYKIFENENAT